MKHISSRDNPAFKAIKKLAESGRERRKSGRILLEGMHLIEAYSDAYGLPEQVIVSASGAQRQEIEAWLPAVERSVLVVDDALFAGLGDVDTPSGILAVVPRPVPRARLADEVDSIVLDGVQDPGNLGSILRSAAAAGCRQAVLSPACAHAWSPKVLRAAMGANFLMDIHENVALADFLSRYRGLTALTMLDANLSVYALDLCRPVAWVFGSEGQGVSEAVADCVGTRVRIPMPGATESLNVAAAAAICLFETVRQRQG